MQITIVLNSAEELTKFLDQMKENQKPEVPTPVVTPAPSPAPAPAPAQAAAPAPAQAAPSVTRQEVQNKAVALMDLGKQAQLQELLKKYGVQALPFVPEEKLDAFMADLEAL